MLNILCLKKLDFSKIISSKNTPAGVKINGLSRGASRGAVVTLVLLLMCRRSNFVLYRTANSNILLLTKNETILEMAYGLLNQ